jgi:hypothetical protein
MQEEEGGGPKNPTLTALTHFSALSEYGGVTLFLSA